MWKGYHHRRQLPSLSLSLDLPPTEPSNDTFTLSLPSVTESGTSTTSSSTPTSSPPSSTSPPSSRSTTSALPSNGGSAVIPSQTQSQAPSNPTPSNNSNNPNDNASQVVSNNQPQNTSPAPSSFTSIWVSKSGGVDVTFTSVMPYPSTLNDGHSSSGRSFWDNRSAVIGVFTVVGLATATIFVAFITARYRRRRTARLEKSAVAVSRQPIIDDDDDGLEEKLSHRRMPTTSTSGSSLGRHPDGLSYRPPSLAYAPSSWDHSYTVPSEHGPAYSGERRGSDPSVDGTAAARASAYEAYTVPYAYVPPRSTSELSRAAPSSEGYDHQLPGDRSLSAPPPPGSSHSDDYPHDQPPPSPTSFLTPSHSHRSSHQSSPNSPSSAETPYTVSNHGSQSHGVGKGDVRFSGAFGPPVTKPSYDYAEREGSLKDDIDYTYGGHGRRGTVLRVTNE